MGRKYRRLRIKVFRLLHTPFLSIPWHVWLIIPAINVGIIEILPENNATLDIALLLIFFGFLSFLMLLIQLFIKWTHPKGHFSLKTLAKLTGIILVLISLGVTINYVIKGINWTKNTSIRLAQVEQRFGNNEKLKCNPSNLPEKLRLSVVRIIGNNMEGSGFYIDNNRIITNFHVIDDEPSPKVVFADNSFEKPYKIVGDRALDLAILSVNKSGTPLDGMFVSDQTIVFGEPVYSVGYPRGSNIPGPPLLSAGSFAGTREAETPRTPELVITNASLIPGMSGGPLVDACGRVLAINTMGEPGIGFYINYLQAIANSDSFTSDEVAVLKVDPLTSEGAVRGFYDLINASRWQEAFDLLSTQRRQADSFHNWQSGYKDTLHVDIIKAQPADGKVQVKIFSRDWVNGNIVSKYFQGEWTTVFVGDVWNLSSSTIKEIPEPSGYSWYWE